MKLKKINKVICIIMLFVIGLSFIGMALNSTVIHWVTAICWTALAVPACVYCATQKSSLEGLVLILGSVGYCFWLFFLASQSIFIFWVFTICLAVGIVLLCVEMAMDTKIIDRVVGIILIIPAGFLLIYVITFGSDLVEKSAELQVTLEALQLEESQLEEFQLEEFQLKWQMHYENLDEHYEEVRAVYTLIKILAEADLTSDEKVVIGKSLDTLGTALSELKSVIHSTSEAVADSGAGELVHLIDKQSHAARRFRQTVNDVKLTITAMMDDVTVRSTSTDTTGSVNAGH